jgi:membrane-associated phospholipid phosphatase
MTPSVAPPTADRIVLDRSGGWILGAVLGAVVLVSSYLLAVWTRAGQALENAALRGADQVGPQDLATANEALNAITLVSLAVAMVVVAAIGLIRRRTDLAVAGVGVIVLGQLITQSLKRFVLPRPPLVEVSGDFTHNSFPSGHTTIAITVLFALVLVVPYRWRGVMMLFIWAWAVGIGAFTITAKWHRFSDTLGAMAVALLCGCVASWWLARRGKITRYTGRAFPGRVVLVIVIAAVSSTSLVLGGFLWGVGFARGVDFSGHDDVWDFNAYLGAHSLSAGSAGLALLLFWGLWHRRQLAPTT